MDEDRLNTNDSSIAPGTAEAGVELSTETPLDESLPADLQVALARFLGVDTVATLREWTGLLREIVGDGAITIDALCLSTEETPHRGVVGDRTYHFACFYDAVILAAIADELVEIRTASPTGFEITARARGTEVLAVDPADSVFSFGIDRHVEPPGETGPSLDTGYEAICPYVRAFPCSDEYHRWASGVPAPTVALPLAGATELAAALAANAD